MILTLLSIALLLGTAVYAHDTIWFDAFDKIDSTFWPYQKILGKLRNRFGRLLDDLNPLRSTNNICSSLDLYELSLSAADIREFLTTSKKNYEKLNFQKPGTSFRKVKIRYKGRNYDAQMRLHGDGPDHWTGKKKSFQLKFPKDRHLEGARRLLFIIPEDRHYIAAIYASFLAKQMGLPYVKSKLAAVKINSVFQGIYYAEEQVNQDFLEQNEISNGTIVQLSDNWVEDRRDAQFDTTRYYGGITYNDHHTTPFDLEMSNLSAIKSEYAQTIYRRTREFFEALGRKDMEDFESLIDMEHAAAADAWRTLLGERHAMVGDNNKIVYSLTSGKFFFIPRSEGDSRTLEYSGGSFESHLNQKAGRMVPLFEMLARSEKVRELRNRWLYEFLSDEKQLLTLFDTLKDKYVPYLKQDPTLPHNSRELIHLVQKKREALQANFFRLRKQMNYVKVYTNALVHQNRLELEILPDTSMQSLQLERLRITLDSGQIKNKKEERVRLLKYNPTGNIFEPVGTDKLNISSNLSHLFDRERLGFDFDDQLLPIPKRYRYMLIFEDRDAISVKRISMRFYTDLTRKRLPAKDTYIRIALEKNDYIDLMNQSLEKFLSRYPQLQWDIDGTQLILKKGTYQILDHMIVPKGYHLVLKAGVTLELGPNVVFLSYSPIDTLGTKEELVTIKALHREHPFGTFAVAGDEKETMQVQYLDLSGGSEALFNGIFFSGALCLYHVNVNISQSNIHDNYADDGLNVKYGSVRIQNSKFVNNFADQIDLDFCQGEVSNSEFAFSATSKTNDGDGLDISGSRVLIRDSSFSHVRDKGISVGEASQVVILRNQLDQNRVGIAVKDSSQAVVYNNEFSETKIGVDLYQKKQIFGGGKAYLLDNRWGETEDRFKADIHSTVFRPTSEGNSYFNSFNWDPESIDFEEIFDKTKWIVVPHEVNR